MITLYNDDNINILKNLESDSVDLTVTSPPYDNLRDYHGYSFDFENVAKELYRVTKSGGAVVWIVNDATIEGSETGTSFRQALYFKEIGFNLSDTMIWNKGSFTDAKSTLYRYPNVFEYMFVFTKGRNKSFNPIKDKENIHSGKTTSVSKREKDGSVSIIENSKTISDIGMRFNIWNIPPVRNSDEYTGHPAQFPEQLARDHVLSWSNEGDTVLDPFMGSGTTGVVCKQTNRNFIGIEISKEYFDIAEKRINSAGRKENLF